MPRRADFAGQPMDAQLDEMRAEREGRDVLAAFAARHRRLALVEAGHRAGRQALRGYFPHKPRACRRRRGPAPRSSGSRRPSGPTSAPSASSGVAGSAPRENAVGLHRRVGKRLRISSHALAMTLVIDAVLFEPPATVTGGKSLSPNDDFDVLDLKAQAVGDGDRGDGIGAGADLVPRHFDRGLALRRSATAAPRPGRCWWGRSRSRSPSRSTNRRRAWSRAADCGALQPNRSAAWSKHFISERLENGMPSTGSVCVSLMRRSSIGSMSARRRVRPCRFRARTCRACRAARA